MSYQHKDSLPAHRHGETLARRVLADRHRHARPTRIATPASALPRVLFVTTEMTDFVKTGGLGDVAAALPRALRSMLDIRVLLPAYPSVLNKARAVVWEGRIAAHAGLPACEIGRLQTEDGLTIYVLKQPELFERPGSPYVSPVGADWSDNALRFATLSMAAARIAAGQAHLPWQPELLHLNDWPTALAAAYARWNGCAVPSVLTLHNLAYQGYFPLALRKLLDIPQHAPEAEAHGQLCFLRAGIAHTDYLSTVSETYAREITEGAHGMGLHLLLQRKAAQGRLTGILNGIDDSWDPALDPALPAPFTAHRAQARADTAQRVRVELGLRQGRGPLFAMVARLVHQKGIDMVCEAAPQIVAAGGQLALLGCGDPGMEREVARLARRFPGQVAAHIGFRDALARRMFAGSDFLLMPSRFEPCGLSQMYAQAYGSLPIAYATGGLLDTIEDGVTGLLFRELGVTGLRHALQRAFRIYEEPRLLAAMRRAAMLQRHDWSRSARAYAALYARAMPQRAAA